MSVPKVQTFSVGNEEIKLPVIEGKKDVFLSYKRSNAPYVARLYKELEQHDIKVWFDLNELHKDVGSEYTNRIHKGIDSCKLFLLMYTKDIEASAFIIEQELLYAKKKGKTIIFFPQEEIDPVTSQVYKYIEKDQWIDTKDSAKYQSDTQEAIKDEIKKAELSGLTNSNWGFSVFEDINLFLIRISLQRKFGRVTPFGNYVKLCGVGETEFFDNNTLKMRIIDKAFFFDIPKKYRKKLEEKNFFLTKELKESLKGHKKALCEVERHIDSIDPDRKDLPDKLMHFLNVNKDIYSPSKLFNWLKTHLTSDKYKSIVLAEEDDFSWYSFIDVVREMTACTFLQDLEAGKTMFNGAELGVYNIVDSRIPNVEGGYVDVQLYYSDYFTFKCMTEMYHILCSIDNRPFVVEGAKDVLTLSPFLCSIGLGGFLVAFQGEKPQLLWAKRSENISSGDMWHFSYDETVSLLKDAATVGEQIYVAEDKSTHINGTRILVRALNEELGVPIKMLEDDFYGIFEIGIIQSERIEVELLSSATIRFEDNVDVTAEFKKLHDASSDGYLEISKIMFAPLQDKSCQIGKLITPEAYRLSANMQIRVRNYAGRKVIIGQDTLIEPGSYIDDGAVIGKNCKIHRNVYVGKNVVIGDYVKIQNNNSIYEGVTLEDGVFVGTNVSFTNDMYPRAIHKYDGLPVERSDWKLLKTHVKRGASIGAGATIRCGVTIGEWAMIGCGAVVVEDVPDNATVVGNPARIIESREILK